MGTGGGGQQSSTTQQSSHLPAWEVPAAKDYLSSLFGLVFPDSTMPSQNLPKGWNVGGSGVTDSTAGTTAGGGGGPTPNLPPQGGTFAGGQPVLNQSVASNFLDPMISGSPYLQNLYGANPAGVQGAMSPAAANQLQMLYSMGVG
jgi:hypothetical protein